MPFVCISITLKYMYYINLDEHLTHTRTHTEINNKYQSRRIINITHIEISRDNSVYTTHSLPPKKKKRGT